MMNGAKDPIESLNALLRSLSPRLMPGCYVYVCLSPEQATSADATACAVAIFREPEGVTLIVEQCVAEQAGWSASFPCAWIQLEVHSALHAVGLTAAVAQSLTNRGISCNVMAAYHHDHLFVPFDRAQDAIDALKELQRSASSRD